VKILENQKKKGWEGILVLGEPNEPILGVSVGMDRFGICIVGGIVPAAAMVEEGAGVFTLAPHCFIPIKVLTRI
jgi:repressor of nif and glnA expression